MSPDAEPSASYTAGDHAFREDDAYAQGKYALTLRWLGPAAGRSLLEVGCGSGAFTRMAAHAGFRVVAYEPDAEVYNVARTRAPEGVAVHQATLEELSASATPADVVVMHDVLEHVADDVGAVDQLAALVRPDGVLIVSVPSQPWLFGLHDEQLGHHRRYTRSTLRKVLARRFEVVHVRSYGMAFIPVTLWFSRIRRRPYPTATASSGGFVSKAFRAMCRLEARIPVPTGTSLVTLSRLRS